MDSNNIYDVFFKERSTHDFELYTKSIGRRKKAEEKIERTPIPMRDGDLVIHTGAYENYERQMVFTSTKRTELSDIFEWLDGRGKLRTSQDEGGFFYASIIGEVERVADGVNLDDIVVDFLVEPFFYLSSGERLFELTEASTLNNRGTLRSEPYIKVYGNGDITLEVNGQVVELKGVEESITMDTKKLICYKGNKNEGKKMKGDYIKFDKGTNNISWTGNVSKVEVVGRWCDL